MTSKQTISEKQDIILDDSTQSLRSESKSNSITLKSDVLYHLGLSTDTHDLPALFGDVQFVCVGGTLKRMKGFAEYMAKELGVPFNNEDLTQASHRYSMFKVGPVLSVTVNINIYICIKAFKI